MVNLRKHKKNYHFQMHNSIFLIAALFEHTISYMFFKKSFSKKYSGDSTHPFNNMKNDLQQFKLSYS